MAFPAFLFPLFAIGGSGPWFELHDSGFQREALGRFIFVHFSSPVPSAGSYARDFNLSHLSTGLTPPSSLNSV